jgi:hypothetical protein
MSADILEFPGGHGTYTDFVETLTIVRRFADGTEVLVTPITTRNRARLRQVGERLIELANAFESKASNPANGDQ